MDDNALSSGIAALEDQAVQKLKHVKNNQDKNE